MPRSTTASTSTTDSPPPQSPLTPPPCDLQLQPYLTTKDVQMFDVDSKMREFNPSSPSSPPALLKRAFPLAPISRNDSLSPNPLSHCSTSPLPAPPSGHDLMQLFPPRPPQVGGLNRDVRHGTSTSSHNQVSSGVPTYINTSTYFGKEEREFFRLAGERVSGKDLETRLENERGNWDYVNVKEGRNRNVTRASTSHVHVQSQVLVEPPIKRRKSVDVQDIRETISSPPPPALALGKLPQRVIRQQQTSQEYNGPPHWQSTSSTTSFPVLQQMTPLASQIQPAANPGTRRRAGKYTKRVFVHPNPLPNVNPPYLLADVHPPGPNSMNPTINVYPLANPRPQKIPVPYPPNSSSFPQPTSQFVQFAR